MTAMRWVVTEDGVYSSVEVIPEDRRFCAACGVTGGHRTKLVALRCRARWGEQVARDWKDAAKGWRAEAKLATVAKLIRAAGEP